MSQGKGGAGRWVSARARARSERRVGAGPYCRSAGVSALRRSGLMAEGGKQDEEGGGEGELQAGRRSPAAVVVEDG